MFYQPMLLQFQEMHVVRSRSQAVLQSGFFHHPRGIYFNLSRECHGNLKCVKMMVWKKIVPFNCGYSMIFIIENQKCRWWFQPHLASSFLEPKITNMLEANPLLPATSIHLSLPWELCTQYPYGRKTTYIPFLKLKAKAPVNGWLEY